MQFLLLLLMLLRILYRPQHRTKGSVLSDTIEHEEPARFHLLGTGRSCGRCPAEPGARPGVAQRPRRGGARGGFEERPGM